jgi:SAM-dependent methyltransferase
MEVKRRQFQGVLNILSFNRHFYVIGLGLLLLITISQIYIGWSLVLYWWITAAFMYGLLMPLIISAYVYDFSGYYHFHWLKNCSVTDSNKHLILNINAGFDETSFIIKSHFPQAILKVFDFYDSKNNTEPAIVRARKVSLVYPNTQQIKYNSIPLEDKSTELVFLLSAAHEIRTHTERVLFLRECYRLCKPHGKVIMVEHLRDLPNFLAFTVGFTHFFSRAEWRQAFRQAGFLSFQETKFTPFMSIFICGV